MASKRRNMFHKNKKLVCPAEPQSRLPPRRDMALVDPRHAAVLVFTAVLGHLAASPSIAVLAAVSKTSSEVAASTGVVYTNQFAVRLPPSADGPRTAQKIADKFGFINIGQGYLERKPDRQLFPPGLGHSLYQGYYAGALGNPTMANLLLRSYMGLEKGLEKKKIVPAVPDNVWNNEFAPMDDNGPQDLMI
ncbi:hypothetical protein AAG570_009523 [Ranatra chinensis]|uniref:Peptidase S8 pro-domain domain-containing protein n=1 Tax=Ranatra chinensis TaxID=642074 RepID=A0ABD0Z2B0_9HEMI